MKLRSIAEAEAARPLAPGKWSRKQVMGHLAEIPEARRNVTCTIGANGPVTLEFLVHDYVVHLEHHLTQVNYS